MSVMKLPSGRWRAQVHDPALGHNVSVSSVLGGPGTFATKTEAKRAREKARELGIEGIRCNAAGCLDRCEFGPNMVIYPEGVWYKYESTQDIDEILEVHVKNGGRVARLMLQPDQLPPKH